jgi:methionine synthase I (cobalamin-dependent)/5,10-methylenetetrahydrofolate reductase
MGLNLKDLITDGKAHVFDGAMGTVLYGKGVFVNVCYDELNLKQPQLVGEVHKAYLDAGAELLETNTFGASPPKLTGFGLADRTEEINEAAAGIALEVADGSACVLGAIGPLGIRIEPFGPTSREEARDAFRRQASGLLRGGVDGFIVETFHDLAEIYEAIGAVREISDLPLFAEMTIGEDMKTGFGTDVATIAVRLTEWGADVVGVNCSVGPSVVLDAVAELAKHTDKPIAAQPNAGIPRDVGDRKIYMASPEYTATYAKFMIEAGAKFVGGCCGTTPEHIKHISNYVASTRVRQDITHISTKDIQSIAESEAIPLQERSSWGAKLARGEFVTSVEIVPPKGANASVMLEQCRELKNAGVDAVNVPDGPRAQSRMGTLPSCLMIEREIGLETVMHYCCRDRNLLGMMSDFLGASAAGLRNVLIITGDPPKMGPYPDATAVFDIDSIGLTNLAYRLNHGMDLGRNSIGDPTEFVIGVGVNPVAVVYDREISRFAWKVDAGADFAVTQPVFDATQFEDFLHDVESLNTPIVMGIWPLVSLRNAEFLANEVPGVKIPDEILDRMRRAQEKGKESAEAEGLAIARQTFETFRSVIQGVQISAPFGRVVRALDVLEGI